MLQIVRSHERYNLKLDWLDAYWHFSFDHYYDPNNMGFGPLRVFNNDTIQPGKGFPMHPHRDMEIVTYVIRGALEHKDSTGGSGVIHAGEVQRMSAGSGIMHSEFNASQTETVELLQMWVLPLEQGVEPGYEQKQFSVEDRTGRFLPIASGRGAAGALDLGQDATFCVAKLKPGEPLTYLLDDGRNAYVFVIDGELTLNDNTIARGDSVKAVDVRTLCFDSREGAELLMINLP